MTDNPRSIAEQTRAVPPGDGQERFAGYGVMGEPFASGHYLAMRHFPASSVGSGYDSVWHRDPAGSWFIYSSSSPEASCARYFGSAVEEARTAEIAVTWSGPSTFTVRVDKWLVWDLELGRSAATVAMTTLGELMPGALWRSNAVLSAMGRAAGPALGVGRVRLTGTTPNGQRFRANPRMLWTVDGSRATIDGVDVGPAGPLSVQARLGDFWLPQRGMFVVGESYFDAYDATRHQSASPRG
ncbi:hypothetical protein [Rhodococcus sp. ARC_M6]|uniref:hypothetical protein n=1 Tax=Rhodococcus sp. ARC_M6 TaxID=2928852 RepID=UPI001FB33668|nr:hypothetical protein [Rhodococcus sp. ARC_M6]MCJ0906148.1 hypothetical protein [Rhodococcus sp. ARC_M6]